MSAAGGRPLTISTLLMIAWAGVALPLLLEASLLLQVVLVLHATAHAGVPAALWGRGSPPLRSHA
ncbi:hypothetical protein WME91_23070 [Sorangium sp. So ce269]